MPIRSLGTLTINKYERRSAGQQEAIIVNLTIKNTRAFEAEISSSGMYLVDGSGKLYSPDPVLSLGIPDYFLVPVTLASGETLTRSLAFRVPAGSTGLVFFHSSLRYGGSASISLP